MAENIAKTTLKLKGAEFFNTSVENIGVRTIRSKHLFDLVALSYDQEEVWLKIAHKFKVNDSYLQALSLETEILAREIISQHTKLKLNEIIEFNITHDLLPNDFILLVPPEGNLLENAEITPELKIQIDEFQSNFYKINNSTFGDLLENNSFISWSAYFQQHWLQLIKALQNHRLLTNQEIDSAEEFYQSLKSTLTEESLPVLINLNLEGDLFIGSYDQIVGYADYSSCFWGTPEFEFAKRDFLKFAETPALATYKQQVHTIIEVKARYFLYLVSFLFEETLIYYCKSGNSSSSLNFKTMALTLIKNALS